MREPNSEPGAVGKVFAAGSTIWSVLTQVLRRPGRGIRDPLEVEAALGLPVVGLIPRLEGLRPDQRPHQHLRERPDSPYAAAVRRVLTVLGADAPGRPQVLLVTSSGSGEGKTALAVSLAALAAGLNQRALVIDLDLRQPSVHHELGCRVSAGIVEYLSGELPLERVIRHDLESGVQFLPVGARTTYPTDLIESGGMQRLLDVCRANYDWIVIDTAPAGIITDAGLAARLADEVLFVVRWGETPASVARDSLQALRNLGVEPAGVVLAQIDPRREARRYLF